MADWNFENRIYVVTGAASGLGFALSKQLKAQGAIPVMLDVNPDALARCAAEVYGSQEAGAAHSRVVDVRDAKGIDAAFAWTLDHVGAIAGVVANAGIAGVTPLLDMDDDVFERIIDVNLYGAMYTCRAGARAMVAAGQGGAIVLLASVAGKRSKPDRIAYATSKGAIYNMTRSLAIDLGPKGIRVNAVAPGVTRTPQQLINPPAYHEAQAQKTALRRLGEPEEQANAIMFLLSDLASYITGETLIVDGGLTINL